MRPGMCLPPVALLTLAGCATTFHAGPPEGAVAVIAHRGASAYAPENTLAAFEKAFDMGADWFELDCHLIKDGKLAVIHDADLKRVANEDPRVVPLSTLEALQQVDAHPGLTGVALREQPQQQRPGGGAVQAIQARQRAADGRVAVVTKAADHRVLVGATGQ